MPPTPHRSAKTLTWATAAAALAVAGTLVLSFHVRRLPLGRTEVLDKVRDKGTIVLFKHRRGDNLRLRLARLKAHSVIALAVDIPNPERPARAVRQIRLTGQADADLRAMMDAIELTADRKSYPIVIVYDAKRPELAVFLATYRVTHDGWMLADAEREAAARTGRTAFPAEVQAIFDALRPLECRRSLPIAPAEPPTDQKDDTRGTDDGD